MWIQIRALFYNFTIKPFRDVRGSRFLINLGIYGSCSRLLGEIRVINKVLCSRKNFSMASYFWPGHVVNLKIETN
jgi:hypothetical protein